MAANRTFNALAGPSFPPPSVPASHQDEVSCVEVLSSPVTTEFSFHLIRAPHIVAFAQIFLQVVSIQCIVGSPSCSIFDPRVRGDPKFFVSPVFSSEYIWLSGLQALY